MADPLFIKVRELSLPVSSASEEDVQEVQNRLNQSIEFLQERVPNASTAELLLMIAANTYGSLIMYEKREQTLKTQLESLAELIKTPLQGEHEQ